MQSRVVFALISMTLFFQFSSGVEVHATTKTEFNDTEINRETSEQLKMIDPYLKNVDGITSFDYDAAMHDNVDPVVLKIGAEINKCLNFQVKCNDDNEFLIVV
ncbi:hypothetical protein FAM18129_00118 [Lacticaseibacillus paracasei]|nr:hypothetical protein FAM18129_00118 [Lacticaseibacillus paracasei]